VLKDNKADLVKSATGTIFEVIFTKELNGMTVHKLRNTETLKETYPVLDLDVELLSAQ
tara:strand:- start:66 stop:239 length:174 start_codon:yes stop_codon:yes gene_type:complete